MILRVERIKKPKKSYVCEACGKKIAGHHIYEVSTVDGDFYYGRFHEKCHNRAVEMCTDCRCRGVCSTDFRDCYYEKYLSKEVVA